jgi:hypothetical protein
MRRTAAAMVLMAALSGCMSTSGTGGTFGQPPGPPTGCYSCGRQPPMAPGVQGPWGQPMLMAQPYAANPPSPWGAHAMMAQSVPLNMVQAGSGGPGGIQQTAFNPGACPPGGCPANPFVPPGGYLTPPGMPVAPGMGPGLPLMPGAGPGMGQGLPPMAGLPMPPVGAMMPPPGLGAPMAGPPAGAVAAVGALAGPDQPHFPTQRTQVRFVRPSGMKVSWYTTLADGKPGYWDKAIEVPGRYNFLQAAIYRLKLSNIEGQPGLELYPTLEVVPANPRTEAFLAHSAVPVEFTKEDFRQVTSGNYLVKVIYLPSPQYQDVAATAPGEIISTQLEPGADPINEALRRGDILLVIRMGNMDQEAPNTPAINAPAPGGPVPFCPPGVAGGMPAPVMGPMGPALAAPGMGMGPGGPLPGRMVPYMRAPSGAAGLGAPLMGQPVMPGFSPVPGPQAPAFPTGSQPAPGPRPPASGAGPVARLPDPDQVQPAASQVPPPPGAIGPRLP